MALPVAGAQLPPDLTKGPSVLVCNWVLAGAATVVVASRLYTKCLVKRTAWWDDATVTVGYVLAIVYSAGATVQVQHGYGRHGGYLKPQDFAVLGLWNTIINCLNAASMFFVRTSICLFLFRMVRGTANSKGWFRDLPVWIALVLNTAVTIGTIVMFSIVCVPLKGLWDKSINAWCANLTIFNDVWRAFISISCLIDFMLAIVPCVRVYRLQLRGKLRLSVNLLLTCGLVTAGMSIGKARYQFVNTSTDPTWDLVASSYFTALEMYFAIIFSSLPAISQLYFHAQQQGTYLPSSQRSLLPTFMQGTPRSSQATNSSRNARSKNPQSPRDERFVPNMQERNLSSSAETEKTITQDEPENFHVKPFGSV